MLKTLKNDAFFLRNFGKRLPLDTAIYPKILEHSTPTPRELRITRRLFIASPTSQSPSPEKPSTEDNQKPVRAGMKA
jgi:hypothetical protein